jgi:hypothetical protein
MCKRETLRTSSGRMVLLRIQLQEPNRIGHKRVRELEFVIIDETQDIKHGHIAVGLLRSLLVDSDSVFAECARHVIENLNRGHTIMPKDERCC